MEEELSSHGSVRWTDEIIIKGKSVEILKSGFLRRAESTEVAYADISKHKLQREKEFDALSGYKAFKFHLFVCGENEPLISVDCSSPNFFPGLMLFEVLFDEHKLYDE